MKAPTDNLIRSHGAASQLEFREFHNGGVVQMEGAPVVDARGVTTGTYTLNTHTRQEGDTDGRLMVGAPILFDTWTEINSFWEGNFMERLAPGSTDRTIEQRFDKIVVAFNHGMDPVIGDKPLGKATVIEPRGDVVWTETPLSRTSYNDDLIELIGDGALYGQSFRFSVLGEEWAEEPDPSDHNPKGLPERTITEIRLFEFGPVTYPAYEATTLGIRSEMAYRRFLEQRNDPTHPGTVDGSPPTPAPVTATQTDRYAKLAHILTADIADLTRL